MRIRILNEKGRAETEARIRELREDLARLEASLANYDQAPQDAGAQHAVINRLEQYIDAVDTKSHSLKAFWKALWQDPEPKKIA